MKIDIQKDEIFAFPLNFLIKKSLGNMTKFQTIFIVIVFILSAFLVFSNIFSNANKIGEKIDYLILGCSIENKGYEDSFYYDKNNKTLEVDVVINCCGVNISVEKHEKTYFIYEKQYGTLCKCLCNKKIIIFNVENDAKVVFVSFDNKKKILSPNLEFCGISTYSECQADEDCITTGCSNQICQSKNKEELMTTCEFKECFDARKFKVSCKCIDNKC